MKKSKLILSMVAVIAAGTFAGCSTTKKAASEPLSYVDDYSNTEEMIKKFPVLNPTPINSDIEKKIQNRLLNGFENYNRGYQPWQDWGEILYTPDSLYNLHGVHMTLEEYQKSQKIGLSSSDIQMGDFKNMIICDNWCAIHYEIHSTNLKTGEKSDGSVMEFVKFKDYGKNLGTRVVEGWAGSKSYLFDSMSNFQTEEEREEQKKQLQKIIDYKLPETNNLSEKYIVVNPTSFDDPERASQIKSLILQDFENWNKGFDTWSKWALDYYSSDFTNVTKQTDSMFRDEYINLMKAQADEKTETRLFFDNLLISGDWAAIHYRLTYTDKETGKVEAGDRMQFLHFEEFGDTLKVTGQWNK